VDELHLIENKGRYNCENLIDFLTGRSKNTIVLWQVSGSSVDRLPLQDARKRVEKTSATRGGSSVITVFGLASNRWSKTPQELAPKTRNESKARRNPEALNGCSG